MNNKVIIDVQDLNKSFDNKPAVINFSLKVNEGEIYGFLGPNGSGKTTTLRMLCGLLTPDSGHGQCLGYDIIKESYQIKKQVGYMTQSFSLYSDLTAFENLDFIARAYQIQNRKKRIKETFELLDIGAFGNKLTGNLSGGMKQRLALAGCLLHDPKLLLLDEPTAGVDPQVRREFWDELHNLSKEGITSLVSTHYMDEAERCAKLVYIAYGHLMGHGTPENIVEQVGLHTWQVSGADLLTLSEKLKNHAEIEQVAFFGNKLHVSAYDDSKMEKVISPFMSDYTWKKIEPSLEDAFINFVQRADGQQA